MSEFDFNWGNSRPGSASSIMDFSQYGMDVSDPTQVDTGLVPGLSLDTMGAQSPVAETGGFLDGAFGQGGWGGLALGGANALFKGWLGMQQLDLAKERLAENKRQFNMNWGAQKRLTNSRLRDRQRARVASNAGAYQSVGDYMNQNGVQ